MRSHRAQFLITASLLVASLTATVSAQSVWYVDDDAPPGGDGLGWSSAFQDLQPAIASAQLGDEVWVAVGRYWPSALRVPGDARSASFTLPVGVSIYGGFLGSEASLAERAGEFERTVLIGDIGAPGVHTDNAYHVVYLPENPLGNIPARLDGFRIIHGNADGVLGADQRGGGVYVTMTLAGPGYTAVLELANCVLRDNLGVRGSALAVDNFGLVQMFACRLEDNHALDKGGAVFVQAGSLRAYSCRLARNSAPKGGAVYLNSIGLDSLEPRVGFANSVFHDNSAERGGAAFLAGGTFTSGIGTWSNCTLYLNHASTSGGAFFARTDAAIPAQLTVSNSILWRNRAPLNPQVFGPGAEVSYSNVGGGGWPGTGNIDANPLFVSLANRDLHTQAGSPVHDAGSNSAVLLDSLDLDGDGIILEPVLYDLDGGRRFLDDPAMPDTGEGSAPIVDMGAYEY